MTTLFNQLIIFMFILTGHFALAQKASGRKMAQTNQIESSNKKWSKSATTVIKKHGVDNVKMSHCETFDVHLGKSLKVDIVCGNYSKSIEVNLTKNQNRSVSRHGGHLTVTHFNFQIKKVQVDQFTQNPIKIPFVEELIHLSIQANGDLAFHQEIFSLDQFGRIVQKEVIEAHGLKSSDLNLTARADKITN
jgi:hypothetical protein